MIIVDFVDESIEVLSGDVGVAPARDCDDGAALGHSGAAQVGGGPLEGPPLGSQQLLAHGGPRGSRGPLQPARQAVSGHGVVRLALTTLPAGQASRLAHTPHLQVTEF